MSSPLTFGAARERYGDALDRLSTSNVADSLDVLGWRSQVLDASIRPLADGMRAFGPASTLQFGPISADPGADPYRDFIDYMDRIESGAVAVVATSTPFRSALWGELFSTAAIGAGVVGVVTDGCIRDTPAIASLGFASFSVGMRPIDYRGRQAVVSVAEPVECGGVTIAHGDWVLADADGVVAIPTSVLEPCLDAATTRLRGESAVFDDLRAGAKLGEVWAKYGLL